VYSLLGPCSHNTPLALLPYCISWVEHDPEVLYQTVLTCIERAMEKGKLKASDIAAVG